MRFSRIALSGLTWDQLSAQARLFPRHFFSVEGTVVVVVAAVVAVAADDQIIFGPLQFSPSNSTATFSLTRLSLNDFKILRPEWQNCFKGTELIPLEIH